MGSAAGAALVVGLLLVILAPVGYAGLRLATGVAPRPADLGVALGIGYSLVLPFFWAERALGVPLLVALLWGACAFGLRRAWPALAGPALAASLVLPLVLGAFALVVNAGDVREVDGGLMFRAGFDVSDRAFYALVAQEVARATPPAIQHPLFSGLPLAYSFFPSLLGVLLRDVAGASVLPTFLVSLPVASLVFIGLAADALLLEMGVASRLARGLTTLLVVMGGDLSFLFDLRNPTALERTRHFLAFHSFSAECLYYNTWGLGLPVALAALILAHRFIKEGGLGRLLLAGFVAGALWETKVFAFAPLLLGAGVMAVVGRRARLAWLAVASGAFALPWVALTFLGGTTSRGSPLAISPLYPVRMSLALIPTFEKIGQAVQPGSLVVRSLWMAAAIALFLIGGFGVRLVGIPRLVGACRGRRTFDLYLCGVLAVAVLMSLLLVGRPVATDGAQFLILAHLLSWLYAGPALAEVLAGRRIVPTALGMALVLAALVAPLGYFARKAWPEWLTPPHSADRLWLTLGHDTVAAAGWLATRPPGGERLLLPLDGDPEDLGGLKPLYVAALANRRLAAFAADFSVDPSAAQERREAAREVYETGDAATATAAIDRLQVRWVWESAARPLRFPPSGLALRFASRSVRIFERTGTGPGR